MRMAQSNSVMSRKQTQRSHKIKAPSMKNAQSSFMTVPSAEESGKSKAEVIDISVTRIVAVL